MQPASRSSAVVPRNLPRFQEVRSRPLDVVGDELLDPCRVDLQPDHAANRPPRHAQQPRHLNLTPEDGVDGRVPLISLVPLGQFDVVSRKHVDRHGSEIPQPVSSKKSGKPQRQEILALGARIRAAREAKDKSQEWLAGILGIDKARVSGWERGLHDPGASFVRQIANATGCDPAWLLRGDTGAVPAAVQEPPPVYLTGELSELVKAIEEIWASGNEVILGALRANIRAFQLAARALPAVRAEERVRRGGRKAG